ncbi:MAG: hypothetical protein M3433_00740 [Actinomycetota bacterium]|nr:hypothetical protein [Actinomycetota bacterium]
MPKPEVTVPPASTAPVRAPANRVVQGILLTGGAVLLALTVGEGRISFYWTPLILGLTYLVAAIVDGPRGGYWATALGLTGWGLAVVYMGDVRPQDIDPAGAYLAGAGLAGIAAAALRSRGFLISEVGFAATLAAAGLTLAFTPRAAGTLEDATTYAIALGVVGLLNVAGGAYQLARGGSRARPST